MDSRVFAAAEQREFAALHEANGMNLAREGLFDGADGRLNEAGPRTMGAPTMPVMKMARLPLKIARMRTGMAQHFMSEIALSAGIKD